MDLTAADRESKLWEKLREHYRSRLATLREQNDAMMAEEDRNVVIGRIYEVKLFLNLDQKPVIIPGE